MNKLQKTLKKFEESLDAEALVLDKVIADAKKDIREGVEGFMTFEEAKEDYKDFFKAKLEKYGVKAPDELDDDKKKEFFDEVDKEWEGEDEVKEAVVAEAEAAKFTSDEPTEYFTKATDDAKTDDSVDDAEAEGGEIDEPEVDETSDDNEEESKKAKVDDQTDVSSEEPKTEI